MAVGNLKAYPLLSQLASVPQRSLCLSPRANKMKGCGAAARHDIRVGNRENQRHCPEPT
jgi:hypothetical protein